MPGTGIMEGVNALAGKAWATAQQSKMLGRPIPYNKLLNNNCLLAWDHTGKNIALGLSSTERISCIDLTLFGPYQKDLGKYSPSIALALGLESYYHSKSALAVS